jgi:alcohol dehydrogenase, propanol-preferring
MEKMHAMLLRNTGEIDTNPLELAVVDKPVIEGNKSDSSSSNEILVKIKTYGVCRSNLHLVEGDWKKYGLPSQLPIIPGHEIVGVVKSIGDRIKRFKTGVRIGIQPLYESCLMWEYCTQ